MTKKQNDIEIKFKTDLGEADENVVDKWELMASRRALQNLKSLISPEQMKELLQGQLDESAKLIKEYLEKSNGEFKKCFVKVEVEGITATDYFKWQYGKMGKTITGTEEERRDIAKNVVFPAHPEHYIMLSSGVVETLGGLPTSASVVRLDKSPQFVLDEVNSDYPHKSYAGVQLEDGTMWGYGLSEFRDTATGAEMRLNIWWPAACSQIFFDDHARHFSVEYRNFLHMAVKEINEQKSQENN
ncbi:hypothetical protein P4263_15715 [Bacillus thuringiensis]|nr:hypothetical protein [Bacillus thuringiensis]